MKIRKPSVELICMDLILSLHYNVNDNDDDSNNRRSSIPTRPHLTPLSGPAPPPVHISLLSPFSVSRTEEASLHTQLWVDAASEFVEYRHAGEPVDVTVSVKELKVSEGGGGGVEG